MDEANWISDDGVLSRTCGKNLTASCAADPTEHQIDDAMMHRIEKYATRMINIVIGAFWKPRVEAQKRAIRRMKAIGKAREARIEELEAALTASTDMLSAFRRARGLEINGEETRWPLGAYDRIAANRELLSTPPTDPALRLQA